MDRKSYAMSFEPTDEELREIWNQHNPPTLWELGWGWGERNLLRKSGFPMFGWKCLYARIDTSGWIRIIQHKRKSHLRCKVYINDPMD